MATVTVGIPDPATCMINPDAGGGGGGPFLPSAVPYELVTADDPVSGSGSMSVAQYSADGVALAVTIEGNDFPGWLLVANSTDGLYFDDGTRDPYDGFGGNIFYTSNTMFLGSGTNTQVSAGNGFNLILGTHLGQSLILRLPGLTDTSLLGSGTVASFESATNPVTASDMLVNTYAADDVALAIQLEGDAFPRWLMLSDATDGLYGGDGTFDPYDSGGSITYIDALGGTTQGGWTFGPAAGISAGDLFILVAGFGIRVKEGANAKQGIATLVGGTVTVNNTSITANSRIFLTAQDNNSLGILRVSARVVGTSFTITSSVITDTGVIAFEIFEPA